MRVPRFYARKAHLHNPQPRPMRGLPRGERIQAESLCSLIGLERLQGVPQILRLVSREENAQKVLHRPTQVPMATFTLSDTKLHYENHSLRVLEAQQRYFLYHAILVAIVSQSSFVLGFFMGYHAIRCKMGVAQICLCETKCQRGVSH